MASISIGISLTEDTNKLLNHIWMLRSKGAPGFKKSTVVEDAILFYAEKHGIEVPSVTEE